MIKTLKNEYMIIKTSSFGAELQEIIDSDGVSRMHDGNPLYWARRSPVLFPIISRFVNKKYTYQGKEYFINTHGFAREKEFIEYASDTHSVTYLLIDDQETFACYPFHFQFFVTFTLIGAKIKVSYKVINTGTNKMYFMVGGHPAFKVPLYPKEHFEDYYLEFETFETVEKTKLNGSYLSSETEPFLENQKIIPLKYKMFDPDAYVMEGLKSHYIDLKSKHHNKAIRFYFSEFKKFAIWSPLVVDAPFVCFEPWNGISQKYVDPIEEKGVLELDPKEQFDCSYWIELIH